ncbi:MAG: ABC transporter ATP-binding protein, partial [Mesorhizobium sp.]
LALILITHDLSVVAESCDRAMIMYAGRIVEDGTVADIFTEPKHPYTKLLIESIPNPAKGKKILRPIPGDPPTLLNRPSGCAFRPRCSFAMDVCATEDPRLDPVGRGQVACHLHRSLTEEQKVAAHV